MKHIYIFNETARGSSYGIGTYIQQMIECLGGLRNVSINIVQFQSEKKEFFIEKTDSLTKYFFPHLLLSDKQDFVLYYRNSWAILQRYINISNRDKAVFFLNYDYEFPLVSLIKKVIPRSSVIFTIHYLQWCFSINGNTSYFNQIITSDESSLSDEKEKRIYKAYIEDVQMFEAVDRIICLSKYTQNLLIDSYSVPKMKTSLIYNGLKDETYPLSLIEKESLKSKLFFLEKEKIILYVGRLDEVKGISILIKAFGNVVRKYSGCRLVIIGEGDYSRYLCECKGIWNKITFTGKLGKEDLYRFYQIADVGVMQSTHEQCSYVAIEMMMHGIPIIATNSTGLSEMVSRRSGFKVSVCEKEKSVEISEKSLSSKILYLLRSSKHCGIKALYSRRRFEKNYSIVTMRKKIQKLIS